jgi:large subunit ribosomal protein L21
MYAIVETGSKQYRVSAGETIQIERANGEPGQSITLDRVLAINDDGKLTVGTPTIANASVVADVLEHVRGPKKIAFKLKRRKGYRRTVGHRQSLTVLRIKEIKA